MIENPVTDLPEPDSPTRPSTLPRSSEGDVVDGLDLAGAGRETGPEPSQLEQMGAHECLLGFSTSRS
jgi:hypothetical protein